MTERLIGDEPLEQGRKSCTPEAFLLSACIGDHTTVADLRWKAANKNRSTSTIEKADKATRLSKMVQHYASFLAAEKQDADTDEVRYTIIKLFTAAVSLSVRTLDDFVELMRAQQTENNPTHIPDASDLRPRLVKFLDPELQKAITESVIEASGVIAQDQAPHGVDLPNRGARALRQG